MFALRTSNRTLNVHTLHIAASRRINITNHQYAATMTTLSDAIIKDHRELKQYYEEVVNNPGNHDHQQRFGNLFTWELARHSVSEELIVYPAFERHLKAKGVIMAELDRDEHRIVKKRLKSFQNMSASDPEYIPTLEKLWSKLEEHIKGEEEKDLPALEKALEGRDIAHDSSEALAKSFERTKAFAPTRSHPSAGEKPPFETVMGLLTAPIDKLADLFRKFPKKDEEQDSTTPAASNK